MKQISSNITGSFILNGVDLTTTIGSSSIWSGSFSTRITSLESFSSSLDATFATDAQLAAATSSLNQYTGSNDTNISNLNSTTASLNSYTASNNTNIGNINSTTASLNSYTGSNNTNIANLNAVSASLNTFTGSAASRLSSIESTTSSLNLASGSAITRLGALEVTSGSNITRISALETASGSAITRLGALETASGSAITRLSSIESTTGSLNAASGSAITRLSALEVTSGSNITRISALEVASGSAITRLSSIESTTGSLNAASGSAITRLNALEVTSGSNITRLSSLESKTGSYATTGSNTFVDAQYISQSSNPTGFTTTASLYTDGGLRVGRDAYISGTLYLNNVTVYGTQSVSYISSSQLNIGTNIISVNTDTPSVRFGGLAVYDSGSTGLTGSILWDSQNNHWVYSNPSGSSYSGGMFISGPRTATLGSEVGTTSCALMMGQGGDHITSSAIFHYGNATCFYGNSYINSNGLACFADTVCANTFNSTNLAVSNGSSNVLLSSNNNEVLRIQGFCPSGMFTSFMSGSTVLGDVGNSNQAFSSGDATGFGINARGSRVLQLGTNQAFRVTVAGTGETTFTCQVCAPSAILSNNVTSPVYNISADGAGVVLQGYVDNTLRIAARGSGYNDGARGNLLAKEGSFDGKLTVSQASTDFVAEFTNTANSTPYGLRIKDAGTPANNYPLLSVTNNAGSTEYFRVNSGTGIATFSGTICVPTAIITGAVGIGVTSPTQCLEVNGIIKSSGVSNSIMFTNRNCSTATWEWYSQGTPGSGFAGLYKNYSTAGTPLVITDCGNVGIGTTSPNNYAGYTTLTLDGSSGSEIDLEYNGTLYGDMFVNSAALYVRSVAFVPLILATNSTERMRITSGGSVGIGCTTPSYLLDVNGTARVMNGIYFNNSGGSFLWEQGNNCLRFGTNDIERFKIAGNGVSCFACQVCAPQYITTQGSSVSYADGSNYLIWNSEGEYCSLDNQTNCTLTTMKTWIADRTGCVRLKFAGYISSGPTYWGWRIYRNNSTAYTCQSYAGCLETGCSANVHGYTTFSVGIGPVNPGDCITLQMVSTGGGSTPAPGQNQYLFAKEFRIYSTTPNFSAGSPSNIFGDRLGVGTCTPNQTLHLYTNFAQSSGVGSAIQFTSDGPGGDNGWIGVAKGTGNGLELSVENRDIIFNTGATTPFGGTERMRVTSAGNVGVGTTSPSNLLHVAGTGRFDARLLVSADAGNEQFVIQRASNNNAQLIIGYHSSGYGRIQAVEQNVGYKTLALNQDGGYVGIGITTPCAHLHVYAAGGPSLWLSSGGSGTGGLRIIKGDSGTAYINNQDNVGMQFQIAGTTRLTIDSSASTFSNVVCAPYVAITATTGVTPLVVDQNQSCSGYLRVGGDHRIANGATTMFEYVGTVPAGGNACVLVIPIASQGNLHTRATFEIHGISAEYNLNGTIKPFGGVFAIEYLNNVNVIQGFNLYGTLCGVSASANCIRLSFNTQYNTGASCGVTLRIKMLTTLPFTNYFNVMSMQ